MIMSSASTAAAAAKSCSLNRSSLNGRVTIQVVEYCTLIDDYRDLGVLRVQEPCTPVDCILCIEQTCRKHTRVRKFKSAIQQAMHCGRVL